MNHSDECEAYALYANNHASAQEHLDEGEFKKFEQDMNKARAAMERAWLEQIPTTGEHMQPEAKPAVELDAEQAKALAAYISKRGFDFEEAAAIGVILELCRKADHD